MVAVIILHSFCVAVAATVFPSLVGEDVIKSVVESWGPGWTMYVARFSVCNLFHGGFLEHTTAIYKLFCEDELRQEVSVLNCVGVCLVV